MISADHVHHPRRPSILAVVMALVMTAGLLVITPSPVSAGVLVPGSCTNWNSNTWSAWFLSEPHGAADDLILRDRPSHTPTGPLYLDMHLPATAIRANDSQNYKDYRAMLHTAPAHASSFTLNDDGSFSYVPVAGYLGGDSFKYVLQQGAWCTNIATVTIAPPAAPRVVDDSYTAYKDTVLTSPITCSPQCGLLRNDLLGPAAVQRVKGAPDNGILGTFPGNAHATPNGSVTVRSDGSFVYTPGPGFTGTDSFYYFSKAGSLDSLGAHGVQSSVTFPAYAKVTIEVVDPPALAPIAREDAFELDEDAELTIARPQLLANDTNSTLIVQVGAVGASDTVASSTTRTAHGELAITWSPIFDFVGGCTLQSCPRSATSIVYTPDPDYNGQDSFSYITVRAWPPTGDLFPFSFPAEVAFEVLPVEDHPRPSPDGATIDENTSVTIDLAANDVDPDGNLAPTSVAADPCVELPVCIFKSMANGSWVLHGDGTVTYTPTTDFTGTAGFHYQISDTAGNTARSFAIVTVNPNPAVDDAYTTDEDTTLVVTAPGVLGNDKVGSTTATLASPPSDGVLTLDANGAFTYVPEANFNGEDSFTYAGLNGDLATVTIDVAPVNDPPFLGLNGTCDQASLPEGQLCVGGTDVRAIDEGGTARLRGWVNDVDIEAGTLVVDWGDGAQTSLGYPCLGDDCGFSEVPTWPGGCGFLGLCSGQLFFDLSHRYADDPPGATDTYAIGVTATDVSGGVGTASASATVRNVAPTVTVQAACNDPLCLGFFSRLEVDDGNSVTVRGRVTDPGTDDGTLVIDWGDGTEATTIDLGCGTGGVCSQAPLHTSRACGIFTVGTSGCGYFSVSHLYAAPSTGDGYVIGLTATDDDGGIGTASATAIVRSLGPVARDASVETDEDEPLEIDLADHVDGNGAAAEDLTYSIVTEPTLGALTGSGATWTYTPDLDVNGEDEFTFEVCDLEALCDTATVSITVVPVNDAPVARDDEFTTVEDVPLDISIADLLANDTDVDDVLGASGFSIESGPSAGTLTPIAAGYEYTPDLDVFGEDSFVYEICDAGGLCDTATVRVTVTPVNDAPHVDVTGPATVAEGAVAEFTFDVTDPDPGDGFELVDGSPSCGVGTLVDGSLMLTDDGGTFDCRFADGPVESTVSVAVVDDEQEPSNLATTDVTVLNVAPVITSTSPSEPAIVAVGAPFDISAVFTDPGDDTHEAVIDWGDGGDDTVLPSVERSGFNASHVYTGEGEHTVTIRVTDSDGAFEEATIEVAVLAHADLVTAVADELATLAGSTSGGDTDRLRKAATALIGNNDGKATNGALTAIEGGDAVVAVSRLHDAAKLLDGVRNVDTSSQQRLLAGVARAITVETVAEAKRATGCEPVTAPSCSPGQRKAFLRIDANVAEGHRRFDAGAFSGASAAYLDAVKAAVTMR